MKHCNLTSEQELLISALSDYINVQPSSAVSSCVDIAELLKLSQSQQLSPIVYYQTGIKDLQSAFAVAAYHALNREKLIESIDNEFREAGIKYLIFKGTEIARYYQHPYLRTAGDVDLLVRAEDKSRAGEILESMGFRSEAHKSTDHEWAYFKDSYEIELHHRLLYDGDGLNDDKMIALTDKVWEHATTTDSICYHLEPEFHFVFVLLHLRKHFLWAGVGIRQFMDLAVMIRNAQLDYDKVAEYIRECGVDEFASVCWALIERMWDLDSPLKKADISDEFYYGALGMILSDGVFGDMSQGNLIKNEALNSVSKHGKIRSTLMVVFPAYEQLKAKYPGMCKNDAIGKLLLPAMWARRMAEAVTNRRAGAGLSYAAQHLESYTERTDMLREWGLK